MLVVGDNAPAEEGVVSLTPLSCFEHFHSENFYSSTVAMLHLRVYK